MNIVIIPANAIVLVNMGNQVEQGQSHHRVEWDCIAKGIGCMAVTAFLWHINGNYSGLSRIADDFLIFCCAGASLNELAIGVGIYSKSFDIFKEIPTSTDSRSEPTMTYDPDSDEVQYSNNGAPYNK